MRIPTMVAALAILPTLALAQNYLLDGAGERLTTDDGQFLLTQAVEPPPPNSPNLSISQVRSVGINPNAQVISITARHNDDKTGVDLLALVTDPVNKIKTVVINGDSSVRAGIRLAACTPPAGTLSVASLECRAFFPRAQMTTGLNSVSLTATMGSPYVLSPRTKLSIERP